MTSIAEINEELRNSESLVEQAEDIINAFIDQQIKAAERRKKEAEAATGNNSNGGNGTLDLEGLDTNGCNSTSESDPLKVAEPAVEQPKAKKVVTVNAGAVFHELW